MGRRLDDFIVTVDLWERWREAHRTRLARLMEIAANDRGKPGFNEDAFQTAKKWLARLEAALLEFEAHNPFVLFRPWDESAEFPTKKKGLVKCHNPDQAKVWADYKKGARRIASFGGEKSGKSIENLHIVWDVVQGGPGRQGCIVGENYKSLAQDVHSVLWEIRAESLLHPRSSTYIEGEGLTGGDEAQLIVTKPEWGGLTSAIIFRTYDNLKALMGLNLDVLMFNEYPPSVKWINQAVSRVSASGGIILVAATFLNATTVSQRIERRDVDEDERFVVHRFDTRNNPVQDRKKIEARRSTMTEAEFRAQVMGFPETLGGYFYDVFRADPPFVFDEHDPKFGLPDLRALEFYEFLDHHDDKPLAWNRVGVDEEGVCHWIDELNWADGPYSLFFKEVHERRLGREFGWEEWEKFQREGFRVGAEDEYTQPRIFTYDSNTKGEIHQEEGQSKIEIIEEALAARSEFMHANRLGHMVRRRMAREELIGTKNYRTGEVRALHEDRPLGVEWCRPWHRFYRQRVPITIGQMASVCIEVRVTEGSRERMGTSTGRKQRTNEDFTDNFDYCVCLKPMPFVSKEAAQKKKAEQAKRREKFEARRRDRVSVRPGGVSLRPWG